MSEDLNLSIKLAMESQSFQTQISAINTSMKVVQSEFTSASTKLGEFGNATDGLKAKASNLGQQLDLQNQIVGKYTDQYNKAKDTLAQNAKANDDLKAKINDVTKAYDASVAATGKNSAESKTLNNELTGLNKQFKDSNSTIASNAKSVDGYSIKLNTAQTSANKLENEIGKTNDTLKNHGKSLDDTSNKANNSAKSYDGLGSKLASFGKIAIAGVAAVGTFGAGLVVMANKTVDNAAAMKKLSVSTQLSINDTQEWAYVFQKTGSSTDVMSGAINKLGITMGKADDDSKKATGVFKDLGISVNDVGGKLKPTGTLFEESITKLAGMKDQTERNILAQKLFGGSYTDLLPILNKGSAGIDELKARAHSLGLVMSDEGVIASAKYKKAIGDLQEQLGAIGTKIMTELLPYLSKMAVWLIANMPTVQAVAKIAFDNIGLAIKAVGDFVNTTLYPAFTTLWAWIQPNIPTIEATVKTCFDTIHTVMDDVGAFITGTLVPAFTGFYNWIQPNMPTIQATVKTAYDTMKTAIDDVIKAITSIIDWCNKYKAVLIPLTAGIAAGTIAYGLATTAIGLYSVATGVATVAAGLFGAAVAIATSPLGIICIAIGLVVAAGVALYENWGTISSVANSVFGSIGSFIGGVCDGIAKGFKGMVNGVIGGLNTMIRALDGLHFSFPDWIPGLGGKSFGLSIPEIPSFSVGTKYLPSDMLIQAHEGEMIVPKSENPYANSGGKVLNNGKSGTTITQNVTINSPKALSASETAKQNKRALQELGLQLN